MKSTGVIRRIDELGRIVIPKEIRRNLGIRDGEHIEIFTDDSSIILKKHSRIANYLEIVSTIGELTNIIMNYSVIVTDRENVIFVSGDNLKGLLNRSLSKKLIDLIDQRECVVDNQEMQLSFGESIISGYFAICPIISSNDSVGLVIIYNRNKLGEPEIKYSKLFAKLVGEKIDIA